MKAYIDKVLPKIEKETKALFFEGDEVWNEAFLKPFYELFNRGGKRLRPVLTCLAHDALGGQNKEIYRFSLIPEILHTGSLIVDDIEDSSDERRGGPTVHKTFGVPIAVNAGNFLYFYPFKIIKESKLSDNEKKIAYEMVIDAMTKLHFGQGMDIYWSSKQKYDVSVDEYLKMASYKTGAITALSLKLGALLAGKELDLDNLAISMGLAFQIKDDILDLKPGKDFGKPLGKDIYEGKVTYLIAKTLAKASDEDKQALLAAIEKKDVDSVIKIFDKNKTFDSALSAAERLISDAKEMINDQFQNSEFRDILLEICDYLVSRDK